MPKAMILGITGQDAYYLTDLLLKKDYDVVGVARRVSTDNTQRIKDFLPAITLVQGDVTDPLCIANLIREHKPDECYNTAAMSHVGTSFTQPYYTFQVDAVGHLNVLEAVRLIHPTCRVLLCATSEMYGDNIDQDGFQDENTRFSPRSPYAAAKIAAFHLTKVYRESYKIFACSAISHNHTSPKRGDDFVCKKIPKFVGRYYHLREKAGKLKLGNLSAKRDWSAASDIVEGFWLMLQREKPEDFVLASGKSHSVEEFLKACFAEIGVFNLSEIVEFDPSQIRPAEVPNLRGNAYKARKELGWNPRYDFKSIVKELVDSAIAENAP